MTGRVCPQESQCEGRCLRGKKGQPVAIGSLERFVADWAMQHRSELPHTVHPPSGKRVAIVGSGPAGLTAAGELVKTGHHVTIFEAFHAAGGVLIYGIPEFRLPKDIVQAEIDRLKADGVEIEVNAIVGKTWTLRRAAHRCTTPIFIAVGAGLPVFMDVPGENLKGVYSANEYLTRVNLMGAYREARTRRCCTAIAWRWSVAATWPWTPSARRSGWAPTRRSSSIAAVREELPARAEEVHHAEQEGVRFSFLSAPVEVLGDDAGWVRALRCVRMELGEPDASRSTPPRAGPRLRVRDPLRDGRGRHRHPLQPAADGQRARPR